MGKKAKTDGPVVATKSAPAATKVPKAGKKKAKKAGDSAKVNASLPRKREADFDGSDDDDDMNSPVKKEARLEMDEASLPPNDVLNRILDRIEGQLPRDDTHKYDSRAKKINWTQVATDGLTAEQ